MSLTPSLLLLLLLSTLSLTLVSAIAPGGEQATYEAYRLLSRGNASSASSSSPPAPTSFASSAPSLSAAPKVGTLRFTLVTGEAAWSPRSIGAVELFTKPLSYTPVDSTRRISIPNNAFVLHGGSGAGNDVWVSGDHGKNWNLAAGITVDNEPAASPADETSFMNYGAAAVLIDGSSNLYRIGGRDGQQETEAVWFSSDALSWKDQADGSSAPFDSQRYYAGATATSRGELVLQGGTVDNFRSYRADVWSSTTQGRSWRLQTDEAAFGARGIGVLLSSHNAALFSGKDILYLLGGQNEKDNSNEVWVSSDSGKTWLPLQLRAPWPQRDAFNGEITSAGVLIISSGLADRDTGLAQETPINGQPSRPAARGRVRHSVLLTSPLSAVLRCRRVGEPGWRIHGERCSDSLAPAAPLSKGPLTLHSCCPLVCSGESACRTRSSRTGIFR